MLTESRYKEGYLRLAYAKTNPQINRAADQCLCFRYILIVQYIYILNPKCQASGCTDRFVSDLVGNSEDKFSHDDAAQTYLSRVMRKPTFCICENKDADQLRGNREADQRLCFRYTDKTIPLLPKSEISSL